MLAHKNKGFTLIELMIVVAILAIIAVYAYSSYSRYGFRARRSDGQQFMTQIAAAEERFFTTFNAYTTAVTTAYPGGLGFSANTSTSGYYTITVATPTASSYLITGAPTGAQASDQCGNLTLTNANVKSSASPTTNGSCW